MASGGLSGILLVGGASRRFGSPKALARLEGETLAERAWRLLGTVCDERIAVGKTADGLQLPFDVSDDGTDVRAALAGIVAGLRATSAEVALVLPVDTPLVRPIDLRRLADACADVATPQTGPLPCALRPRVLPVLETRLRERRFTLRDAFAALDFRTVELDERSLVNVNTSSDLERLEVTIAPLDPREDADGFRRLVADTLAEFRFTADPTLDPDIADPAAYFAAVWIARNDGQVVGSIALRDLGHRELELKRMYLRPVVRGRGTGTRLLRTALDWARAQDARLVKLDTTPEMEAARHLYEAHGFVRVPGSAPRQGQERLLYELVLDR